MSDSLRKICEDWELGDIGYQQLEPLERSCIFALYEDADDSDLAIACSKYGGEPDLPADFKWPHSKNGPLWFTCQINLSELPDHLNVLPTTGLLSFFFDEAYNRAGEESVVLYHPSADGFVRTPIVPDPRQPAIHEQQFPPRSFSFRVGSALPWELPPELTELEEEIDDYVSFLCEFQDKQTDGREYHQLLGLPWGCDSFDNMDDWQLLLQLGDQHDNIYFLMQDADLATRQFDKAGAYFKCT